MWPLIEASILTSAIYTGGVICKHKMKPFAYGYFFMLFWILAIFFGSTVHGEVLDSKTEIKQIKFYLQNLQTKLSKEDKIFYKKKIQFHSENGDRCYKDAKNKCAWLPNFDDRNNAKFCLATAGTLISPVDPISKLILITIEVFVYYGMNVIDEWDYIQNKLNWAHYHYDMMEFYQQVIIQEG